VFCNAAGPTFAQGGGGEGAKGASGSKKSGDAVDWAAVRAKLVSLMDTDDNMKPTLVRLGWHASGTYDPKHAVRGGSSGGTMRFAPESSDGANAGLDKARAFVEPVKTAFPGMSYGDLWTFAAKVAIEEMDGPTIPWRAGRKDLSAEEAAARAATLVPPNGRLPDADKKADHIRDLFVKRMGFTERETVAVIGGGHTIGRCHPQASGFDGPWTRSPTTFSNSFFTELFGQTWVPKTLPNGKRQYVDKATGELMMLETDLAILRDPEFNKIAKEYADNADVFYKDFAGAFAKLLELGCKFE
jgi:cytochrome c peroxidase